MTNQEIRALLKSSFEELQQLEAFRPTYSNLETMLKALMAMKEAYDALREEGDDVQDPAE